MNPLCLRMCSSEHCCGGRGICSPLIWSALSTARIFMFTMFTVLLWSNGQVHLPPKECCELSLHVQSSHVCAELRVE